jgi:phosphate transport system permease protein
VSGTFVTTAVALAIAIPVGTIIAIYLSEFAPSSMREIIKPSLELLSAIPTVVYGYFALMFIAPLIRACLPEIIFGYVPQKNMLSAGIAMGIMIIPYVSSLSEDAMRAVPMLMREGSFALGANRLTTAVRVVYPAALSGIAAAYILGISRAVGETMIVAVAAGLQTKFTLNPLDESCTMTAFIVNIAQGDTSQGSVNYQAIFAVGLSLFAVTFFFNCVGFYLRHRYREAQ